MFESVMYCVALFLGTFLVATSLRDFWYSSKTKNRPIKYWNTKSRDTLAAQGLLGIYLLGSVVRIDVLGGLGETTQFFSICFYVLTALIGVYMVMIGSYAPHLSRKINTHAVRMLTRTSTADGFQLMGLVLFVFVAVSATLSVNFGVLAAA
jgi:hypothetical protein